ncbi:hypothetical protein CRG98_041527 [Punica granatum]|uniref:Uncharacterized protein n=1 Tax=Punica granatum TaxID=22663 RepID=A0A2I0I266_PUNGR|nr:hypothetical protein CRG98_041527 [Punica granatum]
METNDPDSTRGIEIAESSSDCESVAAEPEREPELSSCYGVGAVAERRNCCGAALLRSAVGLPFFSGFELLCFGLLR